MTDEQRWLAGANGRFLISPRGERLNADQAARRMYDYEAEVASLRSRMEGAELAAEHVITMRSAEAEQRQEDKNAALEAEVKELREEKARLVQDAAKAGQLYDDAAESYEQHITDLQARLAASKAREQALREALPLVETARSRLHSWHDRIQAHYNRGHRPPDHDFSELHIQVGDAIDDLDKAALLTNPGAEVEGAEG